MITQSKINDFIPKNNEYYGVIYKVINLINEKIYIGQTIKSKKKAKYYYGSGTAIKHAIKKYGIKNFERKTIEYCYNKFDLNKREIYWINELNTLSPYGYNLSKGGFGGSGFKHSKETKKKMSNAQKGHEVSKETRKKLSEANKGQTSWWKGKKLSKEHKEKLSESKKGEKNPTKQLDVRKKLSESHMGQKAWNKGLTKETDERVKKISESRKGMIFSEEHIKNLKNAKKGEKYYCSECNYEHYTSSKRGKEHLKYKMEGS